jgi:hypothetical protein
MEMTQWTGEKVQATIQRDDQLLKAMVKLYEFQTASEQATEDTKYHNNVGWRPADAPFLTSVTKRHLSGRTLSPKQIFVARRRMMKYAGQIVRIIEGRQSLPTQK